MFREVLGKVLPQSVRSRIRDLLGMPRVERPDALQGEIQFWRNWLSTKGMYWPDDFRARFDPDLPMAVISRLTSTASTQSASASSTWDPDR